MNSCGFSSSAVTQNVLFFGNCNKSGGGGLSEMCIYRKKMEFPDDQCYNG